MRTEWWTDDADFLDGAAPPAPPSPFHGRRKLLTQGDDALTPGCRVALVGSAPGAGASATAWELARRGARLTGRTLWWSAQHDGPSWAMALGRWAAALDLTLPEGGPDAWIDAVAEAAAQGPPRLFVLAGVGPEHLPRVSRLAQRVGSCGVLLAGRTAPPDFTMLSVGGLALVEGLSLLRTAAGTSFPQNDAVALCEAAGGLPLLLGLVGRRFRRDPTLRPGALLDAPPPHLVDGLTPDDVDAPSAVRGLVLGLLADLPARARRTLRAAAFLRGGAVHEAHLGALTMLPAVDVRNDMDDAVARGLAHAADAPSRWTLHPAVRAWLRSTLAPAGDLREVERRHAEHFLQLATRPDGGPGPGGGALIEAEADVIAALASPHADPVLRDEVGKVASGEGGWLRALGHGARAAAAPVSAAPAPVVADPEAVRAMLPDAIEEATVLSLAADESAAQAGVWVDGGRQDAEGAHDPDVRRALDALADEGRKADQAARRAADAVERLFTAAHPDAVGAALDDARRAAADAERHAEAAEARWRDVAAALDAARDAAMAKDARRQDARREAALASKVLDAARDKLRELQAGLPDPMPADVAEAWKAVSAALAAGVQAVREADAAAEVERPDVAVVARHRAAVERAVSDALAAGAEAGAVAQRDAAHREALAEVSELQRRSQESASRFLAIRDRVQVVVGGVEHPALTDLHTRLARLAGDIDGSLQGLRDASRALRQAGDEARRAEIAREARRHASVVSSAAVDALAVLEEAEALSKDLEGLLRTRAVEQAHVDAATRLASLRPPAGPPEHPQLQAAHNEALAAHDRARAALLGVGALTDADAIAATLSHALQLADEADAAANAVTEATLAVARERAAAEAEARQQTRAQVDARAAEVAAAVREAEAPAQALLASLAQARVGEAGAAADSLRLTLAAVRAAGDVELPPPDADLDALRRALDEIDEARVAVDQETQHLRDAVELATRALASWRSHVDAALARARAHDDRLSAVLAAIDHASSTITAVATDVARPPSVAADAACDAARASLRAAQGHARDARGARDAVDPEAGAVDAPIAAMVAALDDADGALTAVDAHLAHAREAHAHALERLAEVDALRAALPAALDEAAAAVADSDARVDAIMGDLPAGVDLEDPVFDRVQVAQEETLARLEQAGDAVDAAVGELDPEPFLTAYEAALARIAEVRGAAGAAVTAAEAARDHALQAAAAAEAAARDALDAARARAAEVITLAAATRDAALGRRMALADLPGRALDEAAPDGIDALRARVGDVELAALQATELAREVIAAEEPEVALALVADADAALSVAVEERDRIEDHIAAVRAAVARWIDEALAAASASLLARLDAPRRALQAPLPDDVLRFDAPADDHANRWSASADVARRLIAAAEAAAGWLREPGRDLDAVATADAAFDEVVAAVDAAEAARAALCAARRDAAAALLAARDAALRDADARVHAALEAWSDALRDAEAATEAEPGTAVALGPLVDARPRWDALDGALRALRTADGDRRSYAALTEEADALAALDARVAAFEAEVGDARAHALAVVAASRSARRDAARAAFDACRAEVDAVAREVAGAVAEARSVALQLDDDDVVVRLEALGASAAAVSAAQDDVVGHALLASVTDDPDQAWASLLPAAAAMGRALRRRLDVAAELVAFDDALAIATRSRLDAARVEVADAQAAAERYSDHAAGALARVARADATWPDDEVVRDATRALRAAAEAVFATSQEVIDHGAVVARTASMRAAIDAAQRATTALARLGAAADALDAAAGALETAEGGAAGRAIDQVRSFAEHVHAHVEARLDAAWQRADDVVSAGAGWRLAEIAEAIGATLAPCPRLARARDHAAALRRRAEALRDVDAGRALHGDLDALRARADALDAEGASAADEATALLEILLPVQIEAYRGLARARLDDADALVGAAVATRLDGEDRAANLIGPEVTATRARLVALATQAQQRMSDGRRLLDRFDEDTTGAAALARLDAILALADDVAALGSHVAEAREAVESAAVNQEAVNRDRAEAVRSLRASCDEVQVLSDELELTLEASRGAFEGQTAPGARGALDTLVAEADRAQRALSRARTSLRHTGATLTRDDLDDAVAACRLDLDEAHALASGALAGLHALLNDHISFTSSTRALLEARMATRADAAAVERLAVDLARSVEHATSALRHTDADPRLWSVLPTGLERVHALTRRVQALRAQAEGVDDAGQAEAIAGEARAAADEVRAIWTALKRDSVRQQVAATAASRRQANALRAALDGSRREAVALLARRAGAVDALLRWSHSVQAWRADWEEVPAVARAAMATDDALREAREADAALLAATSTALAATDPAAAEDAVAAAVTASDLLHDGVARASERVDALAVAIRAAHADATEARERALRRRQEASVAASRLAAGLGANHAARRIPLFAKGLAMARLRGEPTTLLAWLIDLADLRVDAGQLPDARALLDEARAIADTLGPAAQVAVALRVARFARRDGRPQDAVDAATAGLDAVDGRGPRADALHAELGLAWLQAGDPEAARVELESAAELTHVAGDVRSTGLHLGRLARVASAAGEIDEALDHAYAAAEALRRAGDRVGYATALMRTASLLRRRGQLGEAVAHAEASLAAAAHDEAATATLSVGAAWCWLGIGRPLRARHLAEQGLAWAERAGDVQLQAHAQAAIAEATRRQATGGPADSPGAAWAASHEVRRRHRRGRRLLGDDARGFDANGLRQAAAELTVAADLARGAGDRAHEARCLAHAATMLWALGDPQASDRARAARAVADTLPRAADDVLAALDAMGA